MNDAASFIARQVVRARVKRNREEESAVSIVTTYTCDKCFHSQDNPEQMWDIGIAVREAHP